MKSGEVREKLEAYIDILADIEHERWAHWQRYLHSKGNKSDDGSVTIPADLVKKWERQISTPFAELSEEEKDSDREQVRKYLPAVEKIITSKS